MAQANVSVLLNDVRGKADSVVFVNTKDGVVIRPRVTPANPRTAAQIAARGNLSAASTFKNMATDVAAQWNDYAATQNGCNAMTGRTRSLTGVTAYTQLTSKFLQANPHGTAPILPPTYSFVGDTITITATGGSGVVIFTASAANGDNVITELLLQRLPAQNRTPTKRGYRAKDFKVFDTGALTATVAVTPGCYVPAYRFVNSGTGQAVHIVSLPPVQVS